MAQAQDVASGVEDHAPDTSTKNADLAAANSLWREFLETYQNHSLNPLPEAEVTESAFDAGMKALGPRYALIASSSSAEGGERDFAERLQKIVEVEQRSAFAVTELLITAFCRNLDDYSSYETTETKVRLQSFGEIGKGTVGMQLQQASDGSLRCYPFPGQAAQEAGIQRDSRLLSVDGHTVAEATLVEAASRILGPPGTSVALEVRQPSGTANLVRLTRDNVQTESVLIEKTLAGTRIWIRNFNEGVGQALKSALEDANPERPLTLDLRGNGGGVLRQAILSASLFIPEGELIGSLETPGGTERFVDGNPVLFQFPQISLQIDSGTASAAELFVIALLKHVENASLYGEVSHGKGVTTDLVPLRNGGLLNVVSGRLYGPEGESWDRTGIDPSAGKTQGG